MKRSLSRAFKENFSCGWGSTVSSNGTKHAHKSGTCGKQQVGLPTLEMANAANHKTCHWWTKRFGFARTHVRVLEFLAVFPLDGRRRPHPVDLSVSVLLIHHCKKKKKRHEWANRPFPLPPRPQTNHAPLSPFSACSMICLSAFFRLLARSISCSFER